ncbi:alpha-ketoglutarate dehydrogenase component 4 isoform X2 [Narcine bancroftii]|uniref:alpha-ketoglutarate dehydrogenase component 4 isoform X2 n=1 Tax=Narcine bancroftii TaxID=1343680 RepID=UPI003832090F
MGHPFILRLCPLDLDSPMTGNIFSTSPYPALLIFVHEALKSMSVSIQEQQPASISSISSATPVSQISGTRDTIEIVRALPQKYRRPPVSEEEMGYIQNIEKISKIVVLPSCIDHESPGYVPDGS